jgi:hypothetical protein
MKKARPKCAVRGCPRKVVARRLCRPDYEAACRFVRRGEETWESMGKKIGTDLEPIKKHSRLTEALHEKRRHRTRRA